TQELVSFGETALIEAAFVLLGPVGAITITFAGIFATLSSANATIFGSSRTIFRLGKDNTLPSSVGVLNEAYDTPHIGFLLTGIPVLLFIMLGDLELLAEVASFLHLVLYGLICFSLINLRHKKPEWYKPVFVTPAYPFLPLIGGVASFALILFMNPLSQLTGVLLLGLATTFFFVRRKQRKSASEN
ncbi:MAG: APC family permease, partial [Candidatus Thermoplasmatota archaeon]|nr:APC family permease [Candidatus Thermoplasmatota archaeon]